MLCLRAIAWRAYYAWHTLVRNPSSTHYISMHYRQVSIPQMYAPDSVALLQRKRIPTSYTAERNHKNSRIRLRLAQYALNGTYLGYTRIDGGEMRWIHAISHTRATIR